ETALLPLRLAKRPEQSYVITHLIGLGMTNISVRALEQVCNTCSSTVELRRTVETLNDMRDDVFPGDIARWYYEHLVALRYAAAYGYPVRLEPQKEADFIRQSKDLFSPSYYNWIAENLPSTDPKARRAKELLDEYDRN